jgi:hypothetical protein
MNTPKKINLVDDFTNAPGGRYRWQGDHSGEEFREDFLLPAFEEAQKVEVDLNGALGLPSSFLDEAFGELLRKRPDLDSRLRVVVSDNMAARALLSEILCGSLA